jgi:polar amino acid transport system substrate-binding protein
VYLRALLLKRPELMNRFLPLLDKYLEDHISMAIPPGDPELWNYLNFFIKEMIRTGRMQTIINKYFQSGAWF